MGRNEPWIIEDVSIGTQAADQFDHVSVAREIADIVRGSSHSLAIGLLGGYGTGKSSVVRLLKEEFGPKSRQWTVLHVSAERHTGVARGRGLLYGLVDEALRMKALTEPVHQALRAGLEGAQNRVTDNPAKVQESGGGGRWTRYVLAALSGLAWMSALILLVWLLGAIVVGVAHTAHGWPEVGVWTWFTAAGSSAPAAFLLSGAVAAALVVAAKEAAQNFLKGYDVTLNIPRADTADELEQAFLRLITNIDRRVVVAIDDIDRLAAADVLEALATVRSLLLVGSHHKYPPVFLLSCDEAVVREAIIGVRPALAHRPIECMPPSAAGPKNNGSKDSKESEAKRRVLEQAADEYLNKLFTVRISLPGHHGLDMREYAGRLLEGHRILRQGSIQVPIDTVLDVLIHDRVRDPRHVIRLLNGFLTHYRLAERRESAPAGSSARIAKGEVTNYPVELARLTVLQYDFRSMFEDVQREHELLHLLEDAVAAGETLDNPDPLLTPYLLQTDTEQQTPSDLDYGNHPALVYMRAVVPFTMPHRAPVVGPLLTLGSDPDSRHLGSEIARAIREELRSRDVQGFATRLQQPESRSRVLQAAELALTDARRGLALDNAIITSVRGLGLQQAVLTDGEANRLADTAIRLRIGLTTPLDPGCLAVLLECGSPSHHPEMLAELQKTPQDATLRRDWAAVLLRLVDSTHGPQLAHALDAYFATLASDGTPDDLQHWTDSWQQDPSLAHSTWPSSAYAFLLAAAAENGSHGPQASTISQIVLDGADRHRWERRIALGLLDMASYEPGPLPRAAVELLQHAEVPADEWGTETRADQTLPPSTTLAVHLVEAVADHLATESEESEALRAAALLRSWLPDWVARDNRTAIDLTVKAIVDTAELNLELARATRELLDLLPEPDLAGFAGDLSDRLDLQQVPVAVATALRDTLIEFLHRANDSGSSIMAVAAVRVLGRLTAEIETESPLGAFTRDNLPHVLSTPQGKAEAPALAARIINALPNQSTTHATDLTTALHLLMADQAARDSYLPSALSKVQPWMNYSQASQALGFAARYAGHPAVGDQWLVWIAQHWGSLDADTRDHAVQAAGRNELNPPNSAAQLIPFLFEHVTSSSDSAVWEHAPRLWNVLNDDQRAHLLATEYGHCPSLSQQAAEASASVLCSALQIARQQQPDEHLARTLDLLHNAPDASAAIELFVRDLLDASTWQPAAALEAIAASPDATTLWPVAIETASQGRDGIHRATDVIRVLAEAHSGTMPQTFASDYAPLVHQCTDMDSAEALGRAVAPLRAQAQAIARTLTKENNTTQEQKRNNLAFKKAAGLR